MTLAVLPDIALVASDAMRTVIEILAVHTAFRAVEVPFVIFLCEICQFFLQLFPLRLGLAM